MTNTYRGVFRIGACDCDESPSLCEKEKIKVILLILLKKN